MKFNSVEEARDFCDKLALDNISHVIRTVAEKVENVGYDLGDLLDEIKKIRQVLGA